jgi:cysteine desulfurase
MDHAATTPVDKEVLKEMMPYFSEKYGNASSLHTAGQEARKAIELSRSRCASLLNVEKEEIYFTSGGTESDNLALTGTVIANKKRGNHIITSKIEHPAILDVCKFLEKNGFSVTYLSVDRYGLVNPKDVEKAITKKTILITIMHANNEIGTIQPIEEIGAIAKKHKVYFHTDAVQTFGKIAIDMKDIDLLSASSHKIYGPKGVGLIYIKKGTNIAPIIFGGGHERKMRSGTENVPGIVGFGKACELAKKNMASEKARLEKLRNKLIRGLLKTEDTILNGSPDKRLPNNVNVSFRFVEGESIILRLDALGVAASTGSACSSKSLEPSHVLLAIGLKHEDAHGSLRLTLGKINTEKDVDYVLKKIPKIIEDLRKLSPLAR